MAHHASPVNIGTTLAVFFLAMPWHVEQNMTDVIFTSAAGFETLFPIQLRFRHG